jgi:hypothetical protein
MPAPVVEPEGNLAMIFGIAQTITYQCDPLPYPDRPRRAAVR